MPRNDFEWLAQLGFQPLIDAPVQNCRLAACAIRATCQVWSVPSGSFGIEQPSLRYRVGTLKENATLPAGQRLSDYIAGQFQLHDDRSSPRSGTAVSSGGKIARSRSSRSHSFRRPSLILGCGYSLPTRFQKSLNRFFSATPRRDRCTHSAGPRTGRDDRLGIRVANAGGSVLGSRIRRKVYYSRRHNRRPETTAPCDGRTEMGAAMRNRLTGGRSR
jgi:hypothetical protein